ncbi:RNA-binding protein 34 [Salminus brasiliensis]|uniref:RNA-binding protein 34 n=1 Tax=Salminus brasiliensis TaxID=930266 RepID=UPI003B83117F
MSEDQGKQIKQIKQRKDREEQKSMKKKRAVQSEAAEEKRSDAGQDYVVGLVSGSLGAKQTSPSSGALSSLFSTASSNTVVFVPAPKVEPQASRMKRDAGEAPSTKKAPKQKTDKKEKSTAEKKLTNREEALKNADDDEVEKSPKKVKRKAPIDYDKEAREEERPTKRQMTKSNPAEERIKAKRTVFVGNLPVHYQKKNLKKIFAGLGTIESVRFRSVVQEDPSMSRRLATIRRQVDPKSQSINAYVVFKEEEGAKNALERNGMEIEKNVHIRVDRVAKNISHVHKRSIFVGNLPYDIMELPLRQHFEECGQVEAVRLVRDRNSGVGKGFGYVLFASADSVMLALNLNGSELLNRKIRVKRSVKKEKEKEKRGRGPERRNAKGPGGRGAERRKGAHPGRFKGPRSAEGNRPAGKSLKKNPGRGKKSSVSFTGEMTDPNTKKGKGLKKRFKPKKKNKTAHA